MAARDEKLRLLPRLDIDAWRRDRLRLTVLIVLIGLFTGVGISTVYRAGLGHTVRSDYTVYHAAGEAILEGTNIYEARNSRDWYYMYLPAFAILIVPLSLLTEPVAAGVFYVISLAMLLHATWLSVQLASRYINPRCDRLRLGLLILGMTAWPWLSGLSRGQASVMLSWLMILSVACFLRAAEQRELAGGSGSVNRGTLARWAGAFALAGATAMRIFPGLLGLWLLLERRWRAVGACVVAGLMIVFVLPSLVFGPIGNLQLLDRWLWTVALPTGDATAETNVRYDQMMDPRIEKNQSVQASLIRIFAPREEQGGQDFWESIARQIALGLNGLLILVTAGACIVAERRRRLGEMGPSLVQASAILVLCVLLPPVTWVHNLSVLLLPLGILAAFATPGTLCDQHRRIHLAALVLFGLGFAGSAIPFIHQIGGFTWGTLAVWAALVVQLIGNRAAAESPAR